MTLDAANPAASAEVLDLPESEPAAAVVPPLAAPTRPVLDPRTRRLIEAPISTTLLRLAAPNIAVMIVQASLGLIETYFIGWLGTAALAGTALVFPALMLMQMMSAGAIGGGIASAVARALGAGRRDDADRLAIHALAISLGFALVFSAAVLLGGRALYAAMGGSGEALDAALSYSNIVFAGMALIWLFNALGNVIRGTGNMALPAGVSVGLTVVLVPLSPCLIFGWGPFPRLGIAGGGVALIVYYAIGVVLLGGYLASGKSVVRLHLERWRFERRLLKEILRVGAVAALITVGTNATVAVTTSLVGKFGASAIAGYGVGSRLEYMLVPLVFGLGSPLVAMVGTNIGAGRGERALRVAWIGAAIAFGLTEAVGLAAAALPGAWLGIFDHDPTMLAAGSRYLRIVGPCYGLFGLGMALYFASQGAGRLRWPLTAAVTRFVIAAGGGWLAFRLTNDLDYVFIALAVALVAFGTINAAAVAAGAWFAKPAR
ncbi:MAG TPA: MATE family efflux transporter [Stellaceae bacterium]|nr:MATE family efflux transporter [Stellaceae bacterium]